MDLFREARYGEHVIGFGARPAVLTVDFQNAITDRNSPMGRSQMVHDALDRTLELVEEARRAGAPVISCVTAYHPSGADRPRWKVPPVEEWIDGSWLGQLDDRLSDPDDILVTKKAPSIFFGTPVPAILASRGIDTVIITGANTSGCIRASVIDSFSYGWRTVVPRECVGDQGVEPHEQNLQDVARRYADVVALETVVQQLRALAPLPQGV